MWRLLVLVLNCNWKDKDTHSAYWDDAAAWDAVNWDHTAADAAASLDALGALDPATAAATIAAAAAYGAATDGAIACAEGFLSAPNGGPSASVDAVHALAASNDGPSDCATFDALHHHHPYHHPYHHHHFL